MISDAGETSVGTIALGVFLGIIAVPIFIFVFIFSPTLAVIILGCAVLGVILKGVENFGHRVQRNRAAREEPPA